MRVASFNSLARWMDVELKTMRVGAAQQRARGGAVTKSQCCCCILIQRSEEMFATTFSMGSARHSRSARAVEAFRREFDSLLR